MTKRPATQIAENRKKLAAAIASDGTTIRKWLKTEAGQNAVYNDHDLEIDDENLNIKVTKLVKDFSDSDWSWCYLHLTFQLSKPTSKASFVSVIASIGMDDETDHIMPGPHYHSTVQQQLLLLRRTWTESKRRSNFKEKKKTGVLVSSKHASLP